MRRADPTLMPLYFPQPEEASSTGNSDEAFQDNAHGDNDEFNALLSDLNISPSTSSSQRVQEQIRRQRRQTNTANPFQRPTETPNPGQNLAMALLTQFARVTQAVRDIGDHLAKMADDDRRRQNSRSPRRSSTAAMSAALDMQL